MILQRQPNLPLGNFSSGLSPSRIGLLTLDLRCFLIATRISRNAFNCPNITETCRSNRNKMRGGSVTTDYAPSLPSPQPPASSFKLQASSFKLQASSLQNLIDTQIIRNDLNSIRISENYLSNRHQIGARSAGKRRICETPGKRHARLQFEAAATEAEPAGRLT
jgi:hypothetical protein